MAQFKLWGFAAFRQGIGRETLGGQGAGATASGIAQMALSTAMLGYVAMTLERPGAWCDAATAERSKDLDGGDDPGRRLRHHG
jgi:hypothetical protein